MVGDPREEVTDYIRTKKFTPNTMLAMRELVNDIGRKWHLQGTEQRSPRSVELPQRHVPRQRSAAADEKSGAPMISAADGRAEELQKHIDKATKFIPTWVKVAVALALGLGTMVGWKRIVVTVGEKIGKDHLTYGQGAAAEITAMVTIGAAD